jgi:hypothetical protein
MMYVYFIINVIIDSEKNRRPYFRPTFRNTASDKFAGWKGAVVRWMLSINIIR